jgi:hypothetical protein
MLEPLHSGMVLGFPLLFFFFILLPIGTFYLVTTIIHCLLSVLLTVIAMPVIIVVHLSTFATSTALNKEAKQLCGYYLKIKPDEIISNVTLDKALKDNNITLSDVIIATDNDNRRIYVFKDNRSSKLHSFDVLYRSKSKSVELLLIVSLTQYNTASIDALRTLNVGKCEIINNELFHRIDAAITKIKTIRLHSVEEREFTKGATMGFFKSRLSQQIMTKSMPCPKLPQEIAAYLSQFLDRETAGRLAQVNHSSNDTAKAMYNHPRYH